MVFGNIFDQKTVLITGHTGFKGSWLVAWLQSLGATVVGYSDGLPTKPAMIESCNLLGEIIDVRGDICDRDRLNKTLKTYKPDFIFHFAAQAIVSTAYKSPFETVRVNSLGTAALLDALRQVSKKCVAVLITSDKCYENVEWLYGYRENDRLGGKDVYSSSKAAAELVIRSYLESFFPFNGDVNVGIGRAGNVIGGGDWARDRVIVDSVRAWDNGRAVQIRCPKATRPWQHVLEPLSGYLALAEQLWNNCSLHGESFNFGPSNPSDITVEKLISDIHCIYQTNNKPSESHIVVEEIPFNEAGLLKLNCDKAKSLLGWHSALNYDQTVKLVADWYSSAAKSADLKSVTIGQIEYFVGLAKKQSLEWAR